MKFCPRIFEHATPTHLAFRKKISSWITLFVPIHSLKFYLLYVIASVQMFTWKIKLDAAGAGKATSCFCMLHFLDNRWFHGCSYKSTITCMTKSMYANIWPCIVGVPFPRNFITIAKTILKRLFRVYAHIYHAHFDDVITLQEEAHLNTSFKHFIYFVHEFNLIEKRELSPMQELIDRMMK